MHRIHIHVYHTTQVNGILAKEGVRMRAFCALGSSDRVLRSRIRSQQRQANFPDGRNDAIQFCTRHVQLAKHMILRSTTCCLRPNVLKEVTQTLTLYLQNLSVGVTNGGGSSQLTSRVGASPAPSAFGPAMKPSGGPGHTSVSLQAQPPTHGQQQSQQTRISAPGLHLPYQSSEFNAAALASTGTFNSNTDEAFSRSSAVTSFANRLNQPLSGMMQHGPPPVPSQRKPSDGISSQGLHFPTDHQPVALSFSNEPIKIEMSKEAEAEAYGFFQKLLKNISTPDEMFKTVCEYATQGTLAQRKLLDGILRMLADEVSQYLPDYPERMLPLIADLYGSILATSTQLLSIRALSMLWRALLTRLHSLTPEAADTPLFRALILILLKAKNTFTQFYNLPTCLISCPVFKVFPHDLQEQITGLTLYPTQPEPPFKPPDPPEEAITDRIYFLFNNVSQSNAKEKSAELADLLAEDRIIPWFAFYLVGKRVPVEHTFHELFAGVLDQIQERIPDVRPKVMQELIRNVKLLLRSMRKDRDDMQARTALKNLGNFLGLITLARNKPLLHDDLNVKDLIYEAYHKGPISSQYVIPFVARVVRGAANSIVFRPPNPWTMGILRVFREFYELKDVKDCLRFEIELLYRNFTLNLEDVDMMDFLRNRNHAANLEVQLCFFVPPETLITSVPSVTSSAIALTSGVDSTAHTTVPSMINTCSDILSSPVPSQQQQQQQMLNVLAAFQLQQQAATGPQTTTVVDSAISTVNVTQPVYSASGFDLAGMMQAAGASGSSNSSTRALMLAALAANQPQKQLPQQPVGQSFNASNTGTPANASTAAAAAAFSLQQKQLAATMAALQQQQQLQSQHMFTAPGLAPQTGSATAIDSTVEVPGGSLRYKDVDVRSIRACLNLDDLIAAAAAASNRAGGPTVGSNNVTQAAIALLQSNPRLRNLIEPAITRAINELTTPVFERCARITVTTVAAVVRKDFALDPDPGRLLYAAHQMVRHLAAGMSLITAREALGMSLVTALKNIFLAEVQSASGQEKEAVQRLATLVVAKSMHTCLGFMQKSVAEKAVKDVERKLEPDVKLRTELGPRRFLEQATSQLAAQQANMPESLRLTVGGPSALEMSVYEEFGRVIPGFAPSAATSVPSTSSLGLNAASLGQPTSPNAASAAAQVAAYLHQQQQDLNSVNRMQRQMSASGPAGVPLLKPLIGPTSTQQQLLLQQQQQAPITSLLDKIIAQIERHMAFISNRLCSTTDPMIRSLRGLIDAVHLAKTSRDANVAVTVIGIMVRSFLEHYRPSMWRDQPRGLETMEHLKEAHMLTLRHMLSSDQAWVTRQVTQTWIHLDEGGVNKDRSSVSVPGGSETDAGSKLVNESAATASTNITDKPNSADSGGDASWSGWKSTQFDITRTEIGSVDSNGLHSIKWNWEAFAELLKIHVIYLSQADSYLAQEVAAGHSGAIMFVIDLLDHFVLPCPAGTSVGAAAAAAACFARASVNPVIAISGASSGVAQVPGSTASANAVTVSYPSTSIPQPPVSQLKREFTVLNEYDLWSTLEAMRARVSYLNTAVATRSANLTDPLGLRLRLACARVCGLLDLGLLEQSPLFSVAPGASNPISALYAGCSQAREFDDPPNLQEKVELLMRNWVEIYQSPRQRDPATIEAMCSQLVQIGVLPNMDNLTRFLRLATIFVIERALKPLKQQDQQQPAMLSIPSGAGGGSGSVPISSLIGGSNMGANMSLARVAAYVELDAYARLISIIVRRSGGEQSDHSNTKASYLSVSITLLNKVLGIIAGTLLQEHEVRRDCFHPMPFERILIMLFVELHSTSPPLSTLDVSGEDSVEHSHPPNGESASEKVPNSATLSMRAAWPRGRSNLTLQQQLPLVFCHLLHCLRPEKATAFVFSWLEMLAHRWFVGRVLAAPGPPPLRAAYQAMYAQLLVDLLKFLGYFLQNALMPKPIQCLYKATLRLFLVLIHDFPEFVSDYYALFCDVVPSNSIQMRNLILSALPKRGIPSTDPLQAPPVDNLASLEDPTGYCMEAGSRLPEPMRCELDAYLATRAPVKLLSELVTMLRRADDVLPPIPPTHFAYHPQQQVRHQQALAAYAAALAANNSGGSVPKNDGKTNIEDVGPVENSQTTKKSTGDSSNTHESTDTTDSSEQTLLRPTTGSTSSSAAAAALLWGVRATQQLATFGLADGMHYNVELMTNLTLYLCITAIRCLREKGMPLNMSTIAHTPQMDIIQSLVLNLDNEGRYLLLNCMANQLRYPNSHTYYFSYTILYLFSEQSKEQVKEQISRVLMERLIVNRPHPWGLLMTSAELLRNPAYRFWEHEFARCNPEIEAIVTIVARSCIPNFQLSNVSGPSGLRTSSAAAVSASGASAMAAAGDRRRQASPLTRRSPTVTDACANTIRTPRALNSFIPG
ncbi:CCR4-NOT transcription complex subunit 1 [Paragonimus westermani]|uniref:CCR4-NOT transcription complex subunit 1 n=1 Tax=Paragonimus westermani TaxID=34504 RepID=A0A5J4NW10_9TREM|nr:CCR4-NOT transcription complex subunit 1 [Paragonimus westermani]